MSSLGGSEWDRGRSGGSPPPGTPSLPLRILCVCVCVCDRRVEQVSKSILSTYLPNSFLLSFIHLSIQLTEGPL